MQAENKMRINKTRSVRNTIIIGMLLLHAITATSSAGEIVVWGSDNYGVVTNTPAGGDFEAASAGGNHIVALRADGSLVAWGYDYGGQVSNTPTGNNFVAVAAGSNHNVALRTDGSLVAWGYNSNGQVSRTPSGNDFVGVVAGPQYNVALRSDGSLVAWGDDSYGQVSDAPAGYGFVAVAAGYYHSVAVKSDGSLVAWGRDLWQQVSNVPSGNDFVAVAAGIYHSVALKSDGRLVSWGLDTVGQVSNTPTGNDFVAVVAGTYHSVALKSDGSLVAWGYEEYGEISDLPSGNDFVALDGGYIRNVAIRDAVINPTYTLATNVSPSGSGSVTKYPDKSDYNYGESVQLTANVNSGYTFNYWSGDISSYSNPVTIIMNSNKTVTANFTAISKPAVSITATDASAAEPANDGYFRVSRTGDTSSSLLVYYGTGGSTASAGADYAALPGYVYIPSGQSSVSIAVDVIDDSAAESSETVRLTLSTNAAYDIGSPSNATVTIADNDTIQDEPVVTITATDAFAAEPANDGNLTISRAGDTSSSLRVYYSTSGSTASAGSDYVALPLYVDFIAGQSSASIAVVVMDDSTTESTETVQLTIWNLSTYTVGSPSSATVTIADNDQTVEKPIVTITAPDASAGEPADGGYFTVSRTGDTSTSLLVYYSTGGSTATSGSDYAALPGYVYISSGQSSAVVSVDVIDDTIVESSETVMLTISTNAAYTVGSPNSATVTIADNDQLVEKPIVTITAPDASAGEPVDDGYFMVSRTGDTSGSLLVYYSTVGSTATSGSDYASLPGYVYIPAGQSSTVISVVVVDDTSVEDTEMLRLTISSNTAYTVGSPSSATVTITDDDGAYIYLAEQLMADTLGFYYTSVDNGTLKGVGNGKGMKELKNMENMLVTAYDLIVGRYDQQACVQLSDALSRCDGYNDPPDYVSGSATTDLAGMIQEVINALGCL